ncbi:hypothetical protein L596_016873 [Steinernema carpocapsae]|uniref:t-SNARE coiled-coil homology domain-containing protein n=1 Tax=Steinernema carpocapsae TaxID=34508 RepID=A0A4U5NKX8_STECR|nr:hypothetical protein L596_016873 [Steinernema carpocapsae]
MNCLSLRRASHSSISYSVHGIITVKGDFVHNIQLNIESAQDYVDNGNKHAVEARRFVKLKTKICCFGLIGILFSIVIVVVVVFSFFAQQ